MILGLIFFVGCGLLGCTAIVLDELRKEADFQNRYGDTWRTEYEQTFGSLSQAHTRIAIGTVGIVGIPCAAVWLIRVLMQNTLNGGRQAPQKRKSSGSSLERAVRYKRNALLGVYFGVPGILFSVLLAVFRMGIFDHHSDEVVLAIFVFMASYCSVVTGCYWWLKAKAWTEAVVFIAFMPLVIFLIPFVRLVVLAAPALLCVAMVMMPLILVVVVAVLPDKSGRSRRRAEWEKRVRS